MNYEEFDNNINPYKFKHEGLHRRILSALDKKPMHIFELRKVLNQESYVSGQLQFLKEKGWLVNKHFSGVVYWGLAINNRGVYPDNSKQMNEG